MKIAALILALVIAACSGDTPDSAKVVEAFYRARLAAPAGGAPDEAQLQVLAPYLSDELQSLLRQARALHDQQATAAPDEKPDFADGDLFSSLFEGPTAFTIDATQSGGGRQRVPVRMRHGHGQDEARWTDTVIVAVQDGRPVIADIEYGGDWDFANRGSLVATLRDALAKTPAPQPWYGDWTVTGHRIPGFAAVTDEQATTRHGQTATYGATAARFDGEDCQTPDYRSRTLPAAALYDEFRLAPAQLGLAEPVTLVEISCASGQLGPGATLLIQSTDVLLTPWDGAFYELRRQPATR